MSIISARFLSSAEAQAREKPFEIRDERLPGFVLRVQPSGVRSYIAQVGRGKRVTIGKVSASLPADEARDKAARILGNAANGREPMEGIEGAEAVVPLGAFIEETYRPWLLAEHPRNVRQVGRLQTVFAAWLQRPLDKITDADVDEWRQRRLANRKPATVARDLGALASVFTLAMRRKLIIEHPVRAVAPVRLDRKPKVRFLSADEERRLRAALIERDAKLIEQRRNANRGRARVDKLPELPHFGDHLTPAVLLSMLTGLRRGELFALRWYAVELSGGNPHVTVEGDDAKSGQTRHVELNREAVSVLTRWREQTQADDDALVIGITDNAKKAWGALLKAARVSRFRWHDLRHSFASRLVQAGVPLNTVRELLGHGDIKMTLRYAHLAPDQKRSAVELLTPQ